jgi:hypothetical protein
VEGAHIRRVDVHLHDVLDGCARDGEPPPHGLQRGLDLQVHVARSDDLAVIVETCLAGQQDQATALNPDALRERNVVLPGNIEIEQFLLESHRISPA